MGGGCTQVSRPATR